MEPTGVMAQRPKSTYGTLLTPLALVLGQVHDAIMREDNDDVPDGTVLKEFRRGFRLGAQLLRPAMVQVTSSVQLVVCTLL